MRRKGRSISKARRKGAPCILVVVACLLISILREKNNNNKIGGLFTGYSVSFLRRNTLRLKNETEDPNEERYKRADEAYIAGR